MHDRNYARYSYVLVQFSPAATRGTAAKRWMENPFLPKYPVMPRDNGFRHQRSVSGARPKLQI
jgi:hypothetical protein